MKDNTTVVKNSGPLFLEGANGKAVLVQHGFNGYPGEMYGLAERLNKDGYAVYVPRLPGHATTAEDFRKTGWKDWWEHERNIYLNLQAAYDSVTVVGLSMGGVLALRLAEEYRPEKIILLAPAMAMVSRIPSFTPVLRFFIPYINRPEPEEPETEDARIYLRKEYWSKHFTAQIANLVTLIRKTKRKLAAVECPVYLMLSEKDQTVSLEAGDIIERGVSGPVVRHTLKNSPHVFFEGPENDFVLEKVSTWLNITEES